MADDVIPPRAESCKTCRFFDTASTSGPYRIEKNLDTGEQSQVWPNVCRRFPTGVAKFRTDWCGEYEAQDTDGIESFKEALRNLGEQRTCPQCNGRGFVHTSICPTCAASGLVNVG